MFDYENEPQIQARSPYARPGPIPDIRLGGFLEEHVPSLIPRDPSTATSSSRATKTSCGPKDTTGPCERSTSSRDNTTLPITLGVIIPLAAAFIVMVILHRRNLKRQRKEDAEDRVKSLDFGLGPRANREAKAKRGAKGPEMSMTEAQKAIRKDRGLSLDMEGPNPFILPPGLQHSRASLHSLSRSFNTGDDKYARTDFIPDDGSVRSPSSIRRHGDDSSSYTGSSKARFDYESSKTLVQPSTKSGPPTRKASPSSSPEPLPEMGIHRKPTAPPKDALLAPKPVDSRDSFVSTTSSTGVAAFRKSNDYLSAFIRGGFGGDDKDKKAKTEVTGVQPPPPPKEEICPPPPAITKQEENFSQQPAVTRDSPPAQPKGLPSNPRPRNHQEPQLSQLNLPAFSDLKVSPPPEISVTEHNDRQNTAASAHQSQDFSKQDSDYYNRQDSYYGQQQQSQDQSRENSYYGQQQQSQDQSRENSYYGQQQQGPNQTRENSYYDQQQYGYQQYDRQYSQQYDHQYDQHNGSQAQNDQYDDGEDYYDPAEEYEDYDEYAGELGYDPRRLTMGMRPLPPDDPSETADQRANRIRSFYKEYFDAPNGAYQQGYPDEYYDDYYGQDGYYPPRGHSSTGARHRGHTFSNGSYMPGPRAFSSASGRMGHPYGRPGPRKPKKKMPPPKALNILPTPSKLKDDTFLLDQAVDFAPPKKIFQQRSGTPDSLRGGQRPYSPGVKAHIPLTSSFDDLSAMPSP